MIADGDVRFWHLADMQTVLMNVRFQGKSGHDVDLARCLLMTQSGHLMLRIAVENKQPQAPDEEHADP